MAEGTPTGRHRPLTRDPRVRKRLFSPAAKSESSATNEVTVDVWSDDENKALVEFVLLHCAPETWPSHGKASRFWREAAELNLYQGEVKLYISEQVYFQLVCAYSICNTIISYAVRSWSLQT